MRERAGAPSAANLDLLTTREPVLVQFPDSGGGRPSAALALNAPRSGPAPPPRDLPVGLHHRPQRSRHPWRMELWGDVSVGEITEHPDRVAAAALLAGIWGVPAAETPVPADLMAALSHAGGCVIGAWSASGTLVGVAIGLAGGPHAGRVYSYITGVARDQAGRGLGRALKLAQRDWALQRGASHLTWTYDPLIRRNAHFNLNRLGGRVTGFVPDYYPPMLDAVNAGDLPDRFVVEWTLARAPGPAVLPAESANAPVLLAVGGDDEPVLHLDRAGTPLARVQVPSDIEGLRGRDPARGRRWRLAARTAFDVLFGTGSRPVGVDAEGHYVFEKESR